MGKCNCSSSLRLKVTKKQSTDKTAEYPLSKQESICESCSSFCTSSLEYLSAVSSSHTLSETVLYFSLTLLGLVCSFHSRGTSLSDYIICRYNGIIIHFFYFVKGLGTFFLKFSIFFLHFLLFSPIIAVLNG